jgi:hypothetical protein
VGPIDSSKEEFLMRKSLIVSAVIAVSTLFVGVASADEGRGAERPSIQNARNGRNVDAAARTAEKIRENRDNSATRATFASKQLENKILPARNKGDMVDDKARNPRTSDKTRSVRNDRSDKLIGAKVAPRGDIENGDRKNKRTFTIANDRKNSGEHNGPRTIVDVMKRKELLKFLGGAGVKVNCSQTGTCVEETPM